MSVRAKMSQQAAAKHVWCCSLPPVMVMEHFYSERGTETTRPQGLCPFSKHSIARHEDRSRDGWSQQSRPGQTGECWLKGQVPKEVLIGYVRAVLVAAPN